MNPTLIGQHMDPRLEIVRLTMKLEALEKQLSSDRKWLAAIGAILLAFLGYTNLLALPKDVKQQVADQTSSIIKNEVTDRIAAEFNAWQQSGGTVQFRERADRAARAIEEVRAMVETEADRVRSSAGTIDLTQAFNDRLKGMETAKCQLELRSEWRTKEEGCISEKSAVTAPISFSRAGQSEWSDWLVTSAWNDGPWSCISARFVCK
jgi:hypothetical protein